MSNGIIQLSEGVYVLSFPYNPDLVEKVRLLPDRRWDMERKVWTVPAEHETAVMDFAAEAMFDWSEGDTQTSTTPRSSQTPSKPVVRGKATDDGKEITLETPYNPALVDAIREIAGRRWDKDAKVWTVPSSAMKAVEGLVERFDLDLLYNSELEVETLVDEEPF